MLVILATCSAGLFSCRKKEMTPARQPINFNEAVLQKNKEFLASPLANTKKGIFEKKLQMQDRVLQEFARCPECIVRKVVGTQRNYLFDAVTDCDTTMRVGTAFDGGKWICNPQSLPNASIVYSFGVGDDISFDIDMAGLFGCDVHMFDPSPSVAANFANFKSGQLCGRGRIYFQPVGLGPVSGEGKNQWNLVIEGQKCAVKSLAAIAGSLNHTHVDILKIDVEGGEFAALKQMLSSQSLLSLGVQQLLVEFHLWNDEAFADFIRIVGALKSQGFLLFRKEFNPYAADKCAEYAFVRQPSDQQPAR